MPEDSQLNGILNKFPYSGRSDQLERLTEFFVANCEGNQKHVKQTTGISQPTVRKIKKSFDKLKKHDKAVLIGHISDSFYGSALNDMENRD